jgi:NAD(P)-dependent dehydrogenase (short-subunit alcohol dehydrogenase family)
MAAAKRIPLIDWRQSLLIKQLLDICERDSLQFDRWRASWHACCHWIASTRRSRQECAAMQTDRTAIVTGAGKRLGREIAAALIEDGWAVLAHVHRSSDSVPAGTKKVVADLEDRACAQIIFAAANGLPPPRLLVNNAARFAFDSLSDFDAGEFSSHMAVNVRAPALLIEHFAMAKDDEDDGLIVNLLDSKLAQPNPDFLSYTLSKQALAGLTELAARALAPRLIRVNAIAPALMLRSSGQSEENFEAMHARNPLRRGVEPADVIGAIRYLLDARCVTGQLLVIDSGQRFLGLERDVQFLGDA